MGRCRDDHGRITSRERSANESTQYIDEETVVCIQLNNMSSVIVAGRRVRERRDQLNIGIGYCNTHFLDLPRG
jgi:hypothetical protein